MAIAAAAMTRFLLSMVMVLGLAGQAQAGWTAYTNGDAGFNSPTAYANLRTIDFSTGTPSTATTNNTLTTEQTASRITFSNSNASGGSFTQTDTGAADGMSGKHVQITSGTSTGASSLTVNFSNGGTSYVAFSWYLGLKDTDGSYVVFNFSDGTSQTLYSCNTTSNSTCLGAYVPGNFLTNLFNALTLCLFGCNQYDTVYLTYIPSTGVKITSVVFYVKRCDGCGFLGSNTSQDMYVDNLSYVDATVAPHHLEITTPSATINAGASTTFTVKSCADASCSSQYTTGMSGTLTLSGTGMTASYPSGQTYSIGARSSTGTLAASISPAGTATVALSSPSITPTGSPAVYCGIGVAAASGNSCNLTVVGLHHLEVTASSSSATTGTAVTYSIKACADASCATLFTGGVTGNLSVSGLGLIVSYSSASGAFTIGSGGTTSLTATITGIGTATVALTSISPTASGTPKYYCGLGETAASGNSCSFSSTLLMHHLEVTATGGTAVTCKPITYTIKACADASCSMLYTAGVSGTLTVSGVSSVNYPSGQSFSIGSGSSTTTLDAWVTSNGTATVGLSSVLPVATNVLKPVFCGMGAAASSTGSCDIAVSSAAFLFDVPNHLSDTSNVVTVSAVKASASDPTVCTPAFGTGVAVNKTVSFKCAYVNPTTAPTSPQAVKVGGNSLPQCGNNSAYGSGANVTLSFTNGVASTTVQYADVGSMSLSATYTGSGSDAGLSVSGTDGFIAAPASIGISNLPGSYVAGKSYSTATTPSSAPNVTVKNVSGNATPNFGRETSPATATLTWTQTAPSSGAVVAGVFTPTGTLSGFTGGVATPTMSWSEVGAGNWAVSLTGANYLGAGLTTTGQTVALGPFLPAYFDVSFSQACAIGSFTYSGQPVSMKVYAKGSTGSVTQNYYGTSGQAKATTLSAATNGASGAFDNTSVPASSFVAGMADLTRTFTFGAKLTAPTSVQVRAVDTDGVTSLNNPGGETSLMLRSGRLKMFNYFGSEKNPAQVPVQAQYWTGKAWIVNGDDKACTVIPTTAVARSNYLDYKGASTGAWTVAPAPSPTSVTINSGAGVLILAAPVPSGSTGSVDVSLNLGSTTADQSCLASHPSTTGANKAWLRSQNGTCAATYDRDPSARVTFGVFSPESARTVFTRELF